MCEMKLYFETYGCALNKGDSEAMMGLVESRGHKVVWSLEEADIIVINTCTVKTPTEHRMMRRLKELERLGKSVVVTGCLPPVKTSLHREFPSFAILGTNIHKITEAVETIARGEKFVNIEIERDFPCIAHPRINPLIEIVPIAQGCLGECTYCQTRLARGSLKSRSKEEIVAQIKLGLKAGVKEIWITAQDTGAWGLDFGENLADLLDTISSLSGDFRIRVGMMNAEHVIKMLEELVNVYTNEKIYKFLHLPLQSGDEEILKAMGRRYTLEDFFEIVKYFRSKIPELTLSTDVIVGFPGEDENAFLNTCEFISKIKPDMVNVSRYWARPKTKASMLPQHPGRVTKARSRKISHITEQLSLKRNKRWVGWRGKAWVIEKGDCGRGYTARNIAYKPIILFSEDELLGKEIEVEIIEARAYDLRGEVV